MHSVNIFDLQEDLQKKSHQSYHLFQTVFVDAKVLKKLMQAGTQVCSCCLQLIRHPTSSPTGFLQGQKQGFLVKRRGG